MKKWKIQYLLRAFGRSDRSRSNEIGCSLDEGAVERETDYSGTSKAGHNPWGAFLESDRVLITGGVRAKNAFSVLFFSVDSYPQ